MIEITSKNNQVYKLFQKLQTKKIQRQTGIVSHRRGKTSSRRPFLRERSYKKRL